MNLAARSPCDRDRLPSSLNIVSAHTMVNSARARWYAAHESLPPLHEIAATGFISAPRV